VNIVDLKISFSRKGELKMTVEIEKISEHLYIQRTVGKPSVTSFNEQKKDVGIDWSRWSWNPVTGCLFACPYCYAEKIANNSLYGFANGFKVTYYPDRLSYPGRHRIPVKRKNEPGINNVFTCSMADLFGDWIPDEWIKSIMDVVEKHQQYNFIFLTKNPKRYLDIDFPANAWLGATADTQKRFDVALSVFKELRNDNIKFVSCEPLLEHIGYSQEQVGVLDWLIVGGLKNSENTNKQPKREWVETLIDFAKESMSMLYFKTNLTVKTSLAIPPKEYPEVQVKREQGRLFA
jgi:protein gp37